MLVCVILKEVSVFEPEIVVGRLTNTAAVLLSVRGGSAPGRVKTATRLGRAASCMDFVWARFRRAVLINRTLPAKGDAAVKSPSPLDPRTPAQDEQPASAELSR